MGTVLGFLKNSGIFVLGSVLTKMVGFLLLPLYTAWIDPESLGYYDVSLAYLAIVCEALFLNVWVVILRYMFDFDNEEKSYPFISGLVIFAISTVLYFGIFLGAYIFLNPPHLLLLAVYGILQNISLVFKFTARGYGKNLEFAISGVVSTLVMAGLNIFFIAVLKLGIGSLYISMMVGFVVEILYLEWRVGILRRARFRRFRERSAMLLRPMAKYALPIGLNALCYWFIQSFNRVAISQKMSLYDNGIFSVAARFGGVVTLATVAMTYAWQEIAFDKKNQNGAFFGRATSFYFSGLVILVATMLPFIRAFFGGVIGPAYSAALYLVPSAVLVGVMSGYSNFVINIFYGLKQSKTVLWTLLSSALVNVAGTLFLVDAWGLQGANIAAALAFLVNVLLLQLILRRRIGLRLRLSLPIMALGVGVVTGIIYFKMDVVFNLIYGVVLLLSLAGVAWLILRKRALGAPAVGEES